MLTWLMNLIGAFNLTFELFTKLDLKEIQLDTMAYPLMDRCTTDIVFGQGVGVFDLYKASAENMYNKTVTDVCFISPYSRHPSCRDKKAEMQEG